MQKIEVIVEKSFELRELLKDFLEEDSNDFLNDIYQSLDTYLSNIKHHRDIYVVETNILCGLEEIVLKEDDIKKNIPYLS